MILGYAHLRDCTHAGGGTRLLGRAAPGLSLILALGLFVAWAPPTGARSVPEGFPPLGFRPLPPSAAAYGAAPIEMLPTLPPSLDWRDANIITTAKNQLNCGGCWSFAAAGCLEAMAIMNGAGSINFSEQYLLSCDTDPHNNAPWGGAQNDGCCGGTAAVFDFLETNYAVEEAQFPYGNGDSEGPRECSPGAGVGSWFLVPCPSPTPDPGSWLVTETHLLDPAGTGASIEVLKNALVQYGPVWLGYYVYDDFYTFWNSAGPNDVYSHSTGGLMGGHAILLIGYDDDRSAWIIKNSWGMTGPSGDGSCMISYTANTDFGINATVIEVVPALPPTAACCLEDESCYVVSEQACDAASGVWYSGSATCSPSPCPDTAACCFADGGCSVMEEDACTAAGGNWNSGESACTPNPCPQPEAACCLDDGSCQLTDEDACDALSGVWHSAWVGCDPNPCPQPAACCYDDGSCALTMEAACTAAGGTWHSAWSLCDPNPCPQPAACCSGDGSCLVLLESACDALGGTFYSEESGCDPNPCPQLAACCYNDGACLLVLEAACTAAGGTWHSGWTACDPNPCPQLAVCCRADESCVLLLEADCDAVGGQWHALYSECSAVDCAAALYVCCVDQDCHLTWEDECDQMGGAYHTEYDTCSPNPCISPATGPSWGNIKSSFRRPRKK